MTRQGVDDSKRFPAKEPGSLSSRVGLRAPTEYSRAPKKLGETTPPDPAGVMTIEMSVYHQEALHGLVLAPPSRYSEDLDLVQVEAGPIGTILDRLRTRLDPWLGKPTWEQAPSTGA